MYYNNTHHQQMECNMKQFFQFLILASILSAGIIYIINGWGDESYNHALAVAEEAQYYNQTSSEEGYQPYYEFVYTDEEE